MNPFQEDAYSDDKDYELIAEALAGQRHSLNQLIECHQPFIYNLALKMTNHLADAEDVTQDILIKVITNLATFDRQKGRFRTWLYRVTFNHVLNLKKQKYEILVSSFEEFFAAIGKTPEAEWTEDSDSERRLLIAEARVACMTGMLMCLTREQRLVYIVGDLFEIDHKLAAEIFEISPANFRQQLTRARRDLYEWMNNRCGLVNQLNPCRCPKKTKGFIAQGWVNAEPLKWHSDYEKTIGDLAKSKLQVARAGVDEAYAALFRQHPFKQGKPAGGVLAAITSHATLRQVFRLDSA
jgi:RNA polymerase sigma factor (sigma-70 family)